MVLLIGCRVSLHKIGSRAQLSLVTFHLNTYSSLIHVVKPSTAASLFVIIFSRNYVLWIFPSSLLHLIPPVKFLNSMICIISSFSSSASFFFVPLTCNSSHPCFTRLQLSLFNLIKSVFTQTGKEDGKSCQKVTVRMTIRKNDCRSNRPVRWSSVEM